jgi:uncharacterized protein YbjT (DUF2867 family)
MTTVLVTGATGVLGREVVAALSSRGTRIRVASRRPRPVSDRGGYEWSAVDFATGAGLADATADAGVVVHCASSTRPGRSAIPDEDMTRMLIGSLGPRTHIVYISIVGIDRVPLGYYRHKLAAEEVVQGSGRPWTILRTTQFHSLVLAVLRGLGSLPAVMPVPAAVRLQPIAPSAVGRALADLALGDPAGRAPDLGGPEILELPALARLYLRATGRRRRIVEVPLGGRVMRALHTGANLVPAPPGARPDDRSGNPHGRSGDPSFLAGIGPTFAEYLADHLRR